jgi:aerobic carbon-monoxide dehydrogenase large subunit
MHAAIVETDPGTAEVKVLKYTVMHDCGNMVRFDGEISQVQGGDLGAGSSGF